MGVLTDFVVAPISAAALVGETSVPSQEFDGIDAKGIDQIRMGTLYAILSGTEYDPAFLVDESSFVYSGSEDGPWVQVVPDDMVSRLAALSDQNVPNVAKTWGSTEEFEPAYSSWSENDIRTFLVGMSGLARRALAENKALFMWTSL